MMLILAGHCGGRLNVLGVSTVAGNMPLSHTTANALKVLHIAGMDATREECDCCDWSAQPLMADCVRCSCGGRRCEAADPTPAHMS